MVDLNEIAEEEEREETDEFIDTSYDDIMEPPHSKKSSQPISRTGRPIYDGDIVKFIGICKRSHDKYTVTEPMRNIIKKGLLCKASVSASRTDKIFASGYTWHPFDAIVVESKYKYECEVKSSSNPAFMFDPKNLIC